MGSLGRVDHLWIDAKLNRSEVARWLGEVLQEVDSSVGDDTRDWASVLCVDDRWLLLDETMYLDRFATAARKNGWHTTRIDITDYSDTWSIDTPEEHLELTEEQQVSGAIDLLSDEGYRHPDPNVDERAVDLVSKLIGFEAVSVRSYLLWWNDCCQVLDGIGSSFGTPKSAIARVDKVGDFMLAWEGRLLRPPESAEVYFEQMRAERQEGEARQRVEHARKVRLNALPVWTLVLCIALVMPALLYNAIFPVQRVGLAWLSIGFISVFWLLFSLVSFNTFTGKPVPFWRRLLIIEGGQLVTAGVVVLLQGWVAG